MPDRRLVLAGGFQLTRGEHSSPERIFVDDSAENRFVNVLKRAQGESGRQQLKADGGIVELALAYNAAHALSLAALRDHGYRSQSRYLVFQCLQHRLNLPNEQWRVLDNAHRKRNMAEYEGDIDVDEQLIQALIRVTDEVALRIAELQ